MDLSVMELKKEMLHLLTPRYLTAYALLTGKHAKKLNPMARVSKIIATFAPIYPRKGLSIGV